MLGINLLFAGFALTLNGISYLTKIDDKVKAVANILVGIVIGTNAVIQVLYAQSFWEFGFAAAMWLFALNYLIIAAHILLKAENWKVFGIFSGFAVLVSLVFMGESVFLVVMQGEIELSVMIYLWAMWAILWLQSCLSIFKPPVDKVTPHTLIINGVASTFIPGALILLGLIL